MTILMAARDYFAFLYVCIKLLQLCNCINDTEATVQQWKLFQFLFMDMQIQLTNSTKSS